MRLFSLLAIANKAQETAMHSISIYMEYLLCARHCAGCGGLQAPEVRPTPGQEPEAGLEAAGLGKGLIGTSKELCVYHGSTILAKHRRSESDQTC